MKKCNNCSKESYDDAKFCYNCGESFSADNNYLISYPNGCWTSCIRIQNLSKNIDESISFYSPFAAALFRETIECWNHQLYLGCIALSAESVAKAISIELQGGRSSVKRKNIYPKTHSFSAKVNALIKEYPQFKPLENNIIKLYDHYRKTWLHGIGKDINYCKAPPQIGNMKKVVAKGGGRKTILGYMATIPLCGYTEEELHNEFGDGLSDLSLYLNSDKIADKCISLATPILKTISTLYH